MPKPIHRAEYSVLRGLLRQARLTANVKQSDLSEALGKPQPYISAIETGHRRVDLIEARDICLALKVPFVEFVVSLEKGLRAPTKPRPARRTRVD
jgi:transcriptional regulator with XRE-family HTH domain